MAAKRFIYLILTVLALQLSWGVVAAYCQHESGRAAQHFGHHSSEPDGHKLAADEQERPAGAGKKANLHSHCASCAHATVSFDRLSVAVAILTPARIAPAASTLLYSSSYTARPERPQWIAAV